MEYNRETNDISSPSSLYCVVVFFIIVVKHGKKHYTYFPEVSFIKSYQCYFK